MSDLPQVQRKPIADPERWVDDHGDFLFRYAMDRVGNRTVAEDLVQDVFLAAIRSGESFAGRSADRTWFVAILKHKLIDHLRKRDRERPISSVNHTSERAEELFDDKGWWKIKPGDWPQNPRETLENKEFWAAFRHCLERLPDRLRAVFSLRELDSLPTDEVCESLNVTPGHLGVLHYRARMGLRRCLEINWFTDAKKGVQ